MKPKKEKEGEVCFLFLISELENEKEEEEEDDDKERNSKSHRVIVYLSLIVHVVLEALSVSDAGILFCFPSEIKFCK